MNYLKASVVLLSLVAAGCSTAVAPVVPTLQNAGAAKTVLPAMGTEILAALKTGDMGLLGVYVHPTKGVRFSPHGHISTESDRILLPGELVGAEAAGTVFQWGVHDGSGEPIQLSLRDFLQQHIYQHDFSAAPQVAMDEVIGTGNTLVNIEEAFSSPHFIEYHFPGFDPQYDGMDWASLRLIFEEDAGQWWLVGLSSDGWTI